MIIKRIFLRILVVAKAIINFLKKDNPELIWIKKDGISSINAMDIPKIIWMYWDSIEKNYLVDFCIYNTQQICSDYKIIILNKDNISDYIDVPEFKKGLKKAIIADYIRLSLLKKYGGIWMDASILLTENFDWFLSKMNSYENFVFYSDDCTNNLKYPITENWFIAAKKESDFICDWFEEFKKCCLSDDPNNYYEKYKGDSLIQDIPNTDYLMCYISAAIITTKKDYSILYVNSGATGHYYNYKLDWFSFLIAAKIFLCNKKSMYIPPLIKFTSNTRKYSNIFIKNKIVYSNSIFYRRLKDFFSNNV